MIQKMRIFKKQWCFDRRRFQELHSKKKQWSTSFGPHGPSITSVGVLEAMSLASRRLEDSMACPWPWPLAWTIVFLTPTLSISHLIVRHACMCSRSWTKWWLLEVLTTLPAPFFSTATNRRSTSTLTRKPSSAWKQWTECVRISSAYRMYTCTVVR